MIVVINHTPQNEFGLFSLLIALHTWLFTISDSFALQGLIQFGSNNKNKGKVNYYTLIIHIVLTMFVSLSIYLLKNNLSDFFNEKRLIEIGNYLPFLCLAFIPRTYNIKIFYRISNMFYIFITNLFFLGPLSILILFNIYSLKTLTFQNLINYYLISSVLSSVISTWLVRKHMFFSRIGDINISVLLKFGWQMTIANLIYSIPRQLDVFFIQYFTNQLNIVGLYAAAKNIFRVFDEALGAANGIVYPSIIRQIEKQKENELLDIIKKSVSFIFIAFTIITIFLLSGVSNIIFSYILPIKYLPSLDYFNILMYSAPFLAFHIIYSLIIAQKRLKSIILYYSIGVIFFAFSFLFLGKSNMINYAPVPLVIYYIILGLTALFDMIISLKLNPVFLFSGIIDSMNYIKILFKKPNK